MYTIWSSTKSFAEYIINHTHISDHSWKYEKLIESDARSNYFHKIPDHIKQILYLDCPDLIVEYENEPILSIEISTEAGTGHNVFQRFSRLAAAVENGVPSIYIYPKGVIISRQNSNPRWDKLNPLIYYVLEQLSQIYQIPSMFYHFPTYIDEYENINSSVPDEVINTGGLKYDDDIVNYPGCPDSSDADMEEMFKFINIVVDGARENGVINSRESLISKVDVRDRKADMIAKWHELKGERSTSNFSPLSATTKIPTKFLLNYLSKYEKGNYIIGNLLRNRDETIVYKVNAKFRGDPYPGALAAIDYLKCREGKTFEERKHNLIMVWGEFEVDEENETIIITGDKGNINDFISKVQSSERRNTLTKNYFELSDNEIPRYYMQVRYGSTFSKQKHIRVYSYFADAILFPNGSLWRDG